jgi:hypothetical protein
MDDLVPQDMLPDNDLVPADALPTLTDKINQINQELNLPEGTVLRQLKQESGLNLKAYNKSSKAAGLAQVIPETQKSLEKRFGRKLDPYNEEDALLMYKEVMQENLRKFKTVGGALRAYNSGWETAKWDNPETNDYVAKVLPDEDIVPPEMLPNKVTTGSKITEKLKETASSAAKLVDMVGAVGSLPVSYIGAGIAGLTSDKEGIFDSERAKQVKDEIQQRLSLDQQLQKAGLAKENPEALTDIAHAIIGKPAQILANQVADEGTFANDFVRDAAMIATPTAGYKGLRAFAKSGERVVRTPPLDVTKPRVEPSLSQPAAKAPVTAKTVDGLPVPENLLAKEAKQQTRFEHLQELSQQTEGLLTDTLNKSKARTAELESFVAGENKTPISSMISSPAGARRVVNDIATTPLVSEAVKKLDSALFQLEKGAVESNYNKVPLSITNAEAAALGFDPLLMLEKRFGRPLSAPEVVQAQNFVKATNDYYVDIASRIIKGEEISKDTFMKSIAAKNAVTDYLQMGLGESARAMRASQQAPVTNAAMDLAVKNMMDNFGNPTVMQKAAQAIVNSANDPVLAAQTARALAAPTLIAKINQIIVNSFLTSPMTLRLAIESQAVMPFAFVADQAMAATLGIPGRIINKVLNKSKPDTVTFGEVNANVRAFYSGAKEGYAAAKNAWKTETATALPSSSGMFTMNAFGTGPIARAGNTPARLILTQDEFYNGLQYRISLNGLAEREAYKSNLSGKARADLVTQIKTAPTHAQQMAAEASAKDYTFKRDLGDMGHALSRVSNTHPLVKMNLPFVKIGINIGKQLVEHSPLALVSPRFYRDINGTPAARNSAIAKMMIGTTLLNEAWKASEAGNITGSAPVDPAKRPAWLLLHPEDSYKDADGNWKSHKDLGIVSYLLSFGADLHETHKRFQQDRLINKTIGDKEDKLLDEAHTAAYWSLANAIYDMEVNQTWFRTITTIVDTATARTEGGATRGIGQYAAGLLPASPLLGFITKQVDPKLRRTHDSILGPIRARLPWESDKLLPKINPITGLPMDKKPSLSAVQSFDDFTVREMVRLGVKIPLVPKKVTISDGDMTYRPELTPTEQNFILEYRGTNAKETVDVMVALPIWQTLSNQRKIKMINLVYEQFGSAAEQLMLYKMSQEDMERIRKEIRRSMINTTNGQELLPSILEPE